MEKEKKANGHQSDDYVERAARHWSAHVEVVCRRHSRAWRGTAGVGVPLHDVEPEGQQRHPSAYFLSHEGREGRAQTGEDEESRAACFQQRCPEAVPAHLQCRGVLVWAVTCVSADVPGGWSCL